MHSKIYNSILSSIGDEIKTAINEQFSISDIDFSEDDIDDVNIFNKDISFDIYKVYNRIIRERKMRRKVKGVPSECSPSRRQS